MMRSRDQFAARGGTCWRKTQMRKKTFFCAARRDPDWEARMINSNSNVQSQVDEVIDVMQENISKVIERGERLDDLQDKSESLSDNASAFSSRAKHLHRRMLWRNMKMKMIIALVVVGLLLIIIVPVILRYR
ncbi:vesicle-associated membrane protein 4 isoform X4 [Phyllopteryx taeniolatus]|uniref:vesicle-associated membrane protein 4 isoform X4 n=1 Tax=Phyllopteryx taeniolatus TaxID=161469 RepID=UPI002AD3D614|nr:vesicle-associated membrane protein 4 isoform X4 [Phyllopteryx taeniolatus]XP_061635076.1 vesicle-associated membrane protein 4 isoform X4 [Phyllopteryx taeniolatus]XP_061635077.1 vesicle-associated membrane protein 4 isoform X4 [Phyllopteryx taeniolatus]XP_061635078.1 vesicle-associated membrane protein 4 isoform X4 [Phyllopteryx taeniolatus]